LRNDIKQKQNWIKVKLEGVKSNQRDWGAGTGALRRQSASPSRAQPIQFLFLKRFAAALRFGWI